MSQDTLALSRRVVDTFGGRVLGSPSEIARNGRDVAEAGCDWRALGWPATGRSRSASLGVVLPAVRGDRGRMTPEELAAVRAPLEGFAAEVCAPLPRG